MDEQFLSALQPYNKNVLLVHPLLVQKWKLENSFIFLSSLMEMILWRCVSFTSLHLPIALTSCFFPWEALLRYRQHFTHRRQATALLNSLRTFPSRSYTLQKLIHSFFSHRHVVCGVSLHIGSLPPSLKNLNKLKLKLNLLSWHWQQLDWSYRRMAIILGPPRSRSPKDEYW